MLPFVVLWLAVISHEATASPTLRIGSKRFTESYVLGEILTKTARASGTQVAHRQGLGNTAILLAALRQGDIDLYVEYSGTITREILGSPQEPADLTALNRLLAPLGLAAGIPLGFDNRYALAVVAERQPALASISELAQTPALHIGLSHEFLARADGWPALASRYRLPQTPRALDHGLAFDALAAGQIDVTDVYATDARIVSDGLRLLIDDHQFFPSYRALVLHRLGTPARFPQAWAALSSLEGRIDDRTMTQMNAAAEIARLPIEVIAERFVAGEAIDGSGAASTANTARRNGSSQPVPHLASKAEDQRHPPWYRSPSWWRTLARQFVEHLGLVGGSTLAASLVGIALGSLAVQPQAPDWFRRLIPTAVGLLQTIPSLALLALLIPLTGQIGAWPALIALFFYALLPIVSHTITGLSALRDGQREAGDAIGLTRWQRFVHVELSQSTPSILAGIRTAAVIGVGTATVAAFIGAGGFGESITKGLALNDRALLLTGAIPAAVLAWLIDGGFAFAQRRWALRHGQTMSDAQQKSEKTSRRF